MSLPLTPPASSPNSLNEASVSAGARRAIAKNITMRRLFASAAEEFGDKAWEELCKVSGRGLSENFQSEMTRLPHKCKFNL